jgi:hypothetical protein
MPLFRVAVNRDERRARAAALPPRLTTVDGLTAAYPIDPDAGGTWVAASSAGLVFSLLNEPGAAVAPGRRVSRGMVIPSLLAARSVHDVQAHAAALDPSRFAPFRLLVLGEEGSLELANDGTRLALGRSGPMPRLIRTSSSVNACEVRAARTRLFAEMVPAGASHSQDAFHGHQWSDNEAASVLMVRPDARTVSRTVIDVFADRVRLEYCAVPGLTRHTADIDRHH